MRATESADHGSLALHRAAVAFLALAGVGALGVLGMWLVQFGWLADKWGWVYGWRCVWLAASVVALGVAVARGVRDLRNGMGLSAAAPRWAFVCLAVATARYFAVNDEARVLEFGVYASLAAGAAAGMYLLRGRMQPWSRALRGVEFASFTLCATVVLAEIGLRVWAYVDPSPLLASNWVDHSGWVENNRCAPGALHFGFPCDSEGNYDTDVPSADRVEPRVVCIGDSFSFSIVPHAFHFTTVAERELGRGEFYNMGIVGAGPPHYLHMLRTQALPLEPDLIVVNLFLGNDVDAPGQPVLPLSGAEFWLGRENLMVFQVARRLQRMREFESADPDVALGDVAGRKFHETEPWETEAEILANMPWIEDPSQERPTWNPRVMFYRLERGRALSSCRPDVCDYTGILQSMDMIVTAAGDVPIAFLLIPDEFQVNDELWEVVNNREFGMERDYPQQVVRAWMDERDVPYLDLLPILRAHVAEHPDERPYHLQDTHWNALGNRIAGQELARFAERLLESAGD